MLAIFSSFCRIVSNEMPVTKCPVGNKLVDVLSDTRCTGVVVSRSILNDDQLLEKIERCMLISGSILKVPLILIRFTS